MALKKIYWTNTAVLQRNIIFKYWNARNGSNAYSKKLNENIKDRLEILAINPEIGKNSILEGYRVISLGHYSIVYNLVANDIFIAAFWDNRMEPAKLLKLLKIDH